MRWGRSEADVALRMQAGSEELGDCLVQASEIKRSMMSGAAMKVAAVVAAVAAVVAALLRHSHARNDKEGPKRHRQNRRRHMAVQPSLHHCGCL